MQQRLENISQNLWRSQETEIYYAVVKLRGKQFKRSLKTDKLEIARRKLRDYENELEDKWGLDGTEKPPGSFRELCKRFEKRVLPTHDLKPSALEDYKWRIKALLKHSRFAALPLNRIKMDECLRWFGRRRQMIAAQRMNNELSALRAVLEYARNNGWMMYDPTAKLERVRVPRPSPDPPAEAEFRLLIEALRARRRRDAGDFVELLAYSGLRKSEAANLKWCDVDFDKGVFYVAGKGRDETERDKVPLFPAMKDLLLRVRQSRGVQGIRPVDCVMRIDQCKNSLKEACQDAGLRRQFTHHDMRKYFATRCLEQNVPIRTLAKWLRHRDGGALLLRTYGDAQDKHSMEMAAKIDLGVKMDEKARVIELGRIRK